MCEAHRALYVRYIRTHHYFIIIITRNIGDVIPPFPDVS